jgi:predicted enzyme related to lactoylglutathione lyase
VHYFEIDTSTIHALNLEAEFWRTTSETTMIQGLRTAIYPARDLTEGKAWYRRVLDREPYFDEPFYVGFSVGGFELGLIPDGIPSPDGVHALWGVRDVAAELERLIALGAAVHEPVKDVGGGIKVASVKDPFGNVFGIIQNPHFDPKAVQ